MRRRYQIRQGESIDGGMAAARHAESTEVDVERLGRQFGRLFDDVIESALAELFSSVAEIGLGFAELRILRALGGSPPGTGGRRSMSQSDLAEAAGLSPAALQEAVSGLEGRELVASEGGTARLTEGGHEVLRELRSKRQQALTSFVQSRSQGERLRLAGALHLLDAQFDQQP